MKVGGLMTWLRNVVKARTSAGLRLALRDVRTELYVLRLHKAGIKRAQQLARVKPLRLNLGSGFRPRPGWINVDLSPGSDLTLDLREKFPFDDCSVDAIYTEHFFEHLSYPNLDDATAWDLETPSRPSEALTFLRECWRVLAPGGVIDIVVPDAACILQECVSRQERPFWHAWWGPAWCDTLMHRVNYVFRQGREHKYAYDEETLRRTLELVGFATIRRRPFNPMTDADNHEVGSLCLEAFKPARDYSADRNYPQRTIRAHPVAEEALTGTRG